MRAELLLKSYEKSDIQGILVKEFIGGVYETGPNLWNGRSENHIRKQQRKRNRDLGKDLLLVEDQHKARTAGPPRRRRIPPYHLFFLSGGRDGISRKAIHPLAGEVPQSERGGHCVF